MAARMLMILCLSVVNLCPVEGGIKTVQGDGGNFVRGELFAGTISLFSLASKLYPRKFFRHSGHFLLSVHPQWRRSFPCLMALQQNWGCDEFSPHKIPPPPVAVAAVHGRTLASKFRGFVITCHTSWLPYAPPPTPPPHGNSPVWPNDCLESLQLSCLHPLWLHAGSEYLAVLPLSIGLSIPTVNSSRPVPSVECSIPTPTRCTYPNHTNTVAVEMMIVPL